LAAIRYRGYGRYDCLGGFKMAKEVLNFLIY